MKRKGNMIIMGNVKSLFILLFAFIAFSCSSKRPELDENMVDNIVFCSIPRNTESPNGKHTVGDFFTARRSPHYRDTVITDRVFIHKVVSYSNHLRRKRKSPLDIRMVMLIKLTTGETIPVSFGAFNNRSIQYNGISMKPDSLFYDYVLSYAYIPLFPHTWYYESNHIFPKDTTHDHDEEMVPYTVED